MSRGGRGEGVEASKWKQQLQPTTGQGELLFSVWQTEAAACQRTSLSPSLSVSLCVRKCMCVGQVCVCVSVGVSERCSFALRINRFE